MANRHDWRKGITFIDIPPEHDRAIDIAWNRTRNLVPEVPHWMLEILKPRIVGIYMQGLMDGYDARIREQGRTNEHP